MANKKNFKRISKKTKTRTLIFRRYNKTENNAIEESGQTFASKPNNDSGSSGQNDRSYVNTTDDSYVKSTSTPIRVNVKTNNIHVSGINYLSSEVGDDEENLHLNINVPCTSDEKITSSHTPSNINFVQNNNEENINSHSLAVIYTEKENLTYTETQKEIVGHRIVDVSYVFHQIQNLTHDSGFGCNFMNVDFISEVRFGFYSDFWFKCKMCNVKLKISSMKNSPKTDWSINKSIVNSTIAIGIGYTQLNEFFAGLEIPCMSSNSYASTEITLRKEIEITAWAEMQKAGEEEKKIALDTGCIDKDGIPLITVVADGQWSKRSYKTKYDAFSGVASIIGYQTKKVLFVGIRNRYCVICERATNKNIEKPEHICFLNWKEGATSIEADGIAEGFRKSMEMHGVKFAKLIGDGDSSVTKRLHEILPYGQELRVEKIECRNHLLRNYAQKMTALTKRTDFPIDIRKKISNNILRLRSDITSAVKFRKMQDKPLYQKISGLRFDISNAPNHRLFDNHENCSTYFCNKKSVISNEKIKNPKIVQEIDTIVSRLSNNANSLLFDVDNNVCEQFNSVINKFLGGKRINFTQKSSYSTRVYAAVVSFNSSEYLRAVKKHSTQISPGKMGKTFLKKALEKRYTCQKRRKTLTKKSKIKPKRLRFNKKADEHYGNVDQLDNIKDVDDQQFKNEMKQFVGKLGEANRLEIECETRDQAYSDIWKRERLIRLTASHFGRICKMRQNTSCKSTVYSILYSNFTSKSVQYGSDMEGIAKSKFEELTGFKINSCGLFIDEEYPFLAASPDGIIDDQNIVEIKAPYSAKATLNKIEAVESGKINYCTVENSKLKLKNTHNYFYQIQGQMHITRRKMCYFIIYSPQWISVEEIKYDHHFWTSKMVTKLKTFYLESLLPEILDPAYKHRLMISDIRESNSLKRSTTK